MFEIIWKKTKESLRLKLKSQSNLNKETAQQVSLVYNSHENTNNLHKAEEEENLLREYEGLQHDTIVRHFNDEQKEFFYFMPCYNKPTPKSLLQEQQNEKNYFKK